MYVRTVCFVVHDSHVRPLKQYTVDNIRTVIIEVFAKDEACVYSGDTDSALHTATRSLATSLRGCNLDGTWNYHVIICCDDV